MTDGNIIDCDCARKPHHSLTHYHVSVDLFDHNNSPGALAWLYDGEDLDALATTKAEMIMLKIILRMISDMCTLCPFEVYRFSNYDAMFETYKDLIDYDRMVEYLKDIPGKVDWSLPEETCAQSGGRFTWEDVDETLYETVVELLDKHCVKAVKRKREGEETESAPPKSKKNVIIKP